mgnify:FL=1
MIKKYAGIAGVIFNIRPPKEGFSEKFAEI